jgi:hypothetical protein
MGCKILGDGLVWLPLTLLAIAPGGCAGTSTPSNTGQPADETGDSTIINPGSPDDEADGAHGNGPVNGIPGNDDLAAPGTPTAKRSYLEGLAESQGPGDHFDFDEASHWVRTSSLHGTEFSIAIDRTVLDAAEGLLADEFADFVEACFHAAWHVYDGYAFDRYAVRVRAEDGDEGFSLSPVGITISAADYAAPWGLEVIAHEMFHSWNGKFVQPEPDAPDDLFQWETWIVEGATVYYSFRHMGFALGEDEFEDGMSFRLETYHEYVGTDYDLSIAELAAMIGSAPPGDASTQAPTNMLYARGALVCYMLDLELAEEGLSLDDVLRSLYLDALAGRKWTRARLQEVVESLSDIDFEAFLAQWIDRNAELPLDGAFELRD